MLQSSLLGITEGNRLEMAAAGVPGGPTRHDDRQQREPDHARAPHGQFTVRSASSQPEEINLPTSRNSSMRGTRVEFQRGTMADLQSEYMQSQKNERIQLGPTASRPHIQDTLQGDDDGQKKMGMCELWFWILIQMVILCVILPLCALPVLLWVPKIRDKWHGKWPNQFPDDLVYTAWVGGGIIPSILYLAWEYRNKKEELRWSYLLFTAIMDVFQGSVAYVLVLAYLLDVHFCQSTTSNGTERADVVVDKGEYFYPALAFLFVSLLRAHSSVGYAKEKQSLAKSNFVMYAFRRVISGVASVDPTCCGCCKRVIERAKQKKLAVQKEMIKSINELDFEGKYSFKNSLRFQELERSMISGAKFREQFKLPPEFKILLPNMGASEVLAEEISQDEDENVILFTSDMLISQPCIAAIARQYGDTSYRDPDRAIGDEIEEMKSSDIVRMIILLSRADQISRHKWWWWFVAGISFLHAAIPILRKVANKVFIEHVTGHWTSLLMGGAGVLALVVALLGSSAKTGYCKGHMGYWTSLVLGSIGSILIVVPVVTFNDGSSFLCLSTASFIVNYTLTWSITIRMAKCYEDYYEKYCRLTHFLHLTPWPTMKKKLMRPSFGLLPIFDLTTIENIEAWNKMRIFLQTYEIKYSRGRQLPVVYMLFAWVSTSIYSFVNFLDPTQNDDNDSTWFLLSNTFQLAIGLSLILVCGKWTNELQETGFMHMLRVKQTLLRCKGAFFLDEQKECYPHQKGSSPGAASHAQNRAEERSEANFKCAVLDSIIESIANEQSGHERTHWGDEDRRCKLMMFAMSQRNLIAFWSTIVSVVAREAYSSLQHLFKYDYHAKWQDAEQNKTCAAVGIDIMVELAKQWSLSVEQDSGNDGM